MGEYTRLWWSPRFGAPSRAERMGGWYRAYSPDLLAGWDPLIPGSLAASVSEAEAAVRDLNSSDVHPGLAGVARFLLRAESVGSSAIEGLRVGHRRLLAAEEQVAKGLAVTDGEASEVIGNIDAMRQAVDLAAQPGPLSLEGLLEVHKLLMDRSPSPELGGVLREEQGWIGGGNFNPCNAAYVPPPPDRVPELMSDLVAYVNTEYHTPLTQAAVAHAQFETIHPFGDGNGRAGRALIHIVLQRRGLAPRIVPPISLVLSTWSDSYIEGLTAFRHEGPPDSAQRDDALQPWMDTFATATRRACDDALEYSDRISQLTDEWNQKLGRYRKGSALDLLVERLPGVPLLTPDKAAQLIGRSPVAARAAIAQLLEAGILRLRPSSSPRNRVFEAPSVIHMLTSLERSLATPHANTLRERPVRPVPDRPPPTNIPVYAPADTGGRLAGSDAVGVHVRPSPLDDHGWEVATTEPDGTPLPLSGPHQTVEAAEAARDFMVGLVNGHPQLHILGEDPQRSAGTDVGPYTPPPRDRTPTVGVYAPDQDGPWYVQCRNPDGTEDATSPPYATHQAASNALDQLGLLTVATADRDLGHRATVEPTSTSCRCSRSGWQCGHIEASPLEAEPPDRNRGLSL